jgi:hypothetical protein
VSMTTPPWFAAAKIPIAAALPSYSPEGFFG